MKPFSKTATKIYRKCIKCITFPSTSGNNESVQPNAESKVDISWVLEKLGPWNLRTCTSVSKEWKRAVEEVLLSTNIQEHWVFRIDNGSLLYMQSVVTGKEWKVELGELTHSGKGREVLCSFSGLLLVAFNAEREEIIWTTSLLLGDPLLNEWIELPPIPGTHGDQQLVIAGFCSPCTIIVGDITGKFTATFSLVTGIDTLHCEVGCAISGANAVCCLDGVFYTTFREPWNDTTRTVLKYYDPQAKHRQWQKVKYLHLNGTSAELQMIDNFTFTDCSRILQLYAHVGKGHAHVGEGEVAYLLVSKADNNDLNILCLVKEELLGTLYGGNGMYFGIGNILEKRTLVVSVKDRKVKELKDNYSGYYITAHGTLASLKAKLSTVK